MYLLNLNWASVVYHENGREQIVANEVQMANGINISPDKRLVNLTMVGCNLNRTTTEIQKSLYFLYFWKMYRQARK